MAKIRQLPVALTIAGSDSGGGAGIQADLKTFAALGVHGTSAITCITAQNPRRVTGIQPISADMVYSQIEAVFDELPPAAAKTGMLFSAGIIRVVARLFRRRPETPLIVDPVMVSTSGARLLQPAAISILRNELLPMATLVTPNLDEAEILTGRKISSVENMRPAAKELHMQFGCAVLVKGGHLRGLKEAVDVFYDGKQELLLVSPLIKGIRTHGTGCTSSAAIAGYMALGQTLPKAVKLAKDYIANAISHSQFAGRHSVSNHFWRKRI